MLSIRVGGAGVSQDLRQLGEQRADDVLLLRRRARGAPRVRHRRAARAASRHASARRRDRRDGRAGGDLPRGNAGRPSAHGWGAAMSTDTAFALGMLALVGPRFPIRLRAFMLTVVVVDDVVALVVIAHRLHGASGRASAAARRRPPRGRRGRSSASAFATGLVVPRARRRGVGRAVRVGRRPDRRRARRSGSWRSPTPRRASTSSGRRDLFRLFREQPTPELARSAQLGAAVGDLAERAAPAALPPVDELRDRAAVRARERRDRDQRRLPRARVHVADHARDPARLRRRQAGRRRRRRLARHEADARPAAAAGRLGGGRGRRHDRRHRLHRLAADRDARLPRRAARGGEARRPQRRPRRVARHLARLPRDGAAAEARCRSARCSARPRCSSTSPSRSTASATTSAGPRTRR